VIPDPEKVVEPLTTTVSVEPWRVVMVNFELDTDATTPTACGGLNPLGRTEFGFVRGVTPEAGACSARVDELEERAAATRPAEVPTAITATTPMASQMNFRFGCQFVIGTSLLLTEFPPATDITKCSQLNL
jgi:hypothetical protein